MVNFGRRFHPEPGQNCTPVHSGSCIGHAAGNPTHGPQGSVNPLPSRPPKPLPGYTPSEPLTHPARPSARPPPSALRHLPGRGFLLEPPLPSRHGTPSPLPLQGGGLTHQGERLLPLMLPRPGRVLRTCRGWWALRRLQRRGSQNGEGLAPGRDFGESTWWLEGERLEGRGSKYGLLMKCRCSNCRTRRNPPAGVR